MQGGLRAVVWTDLFQGLVMIGGLVAIIVQERTDRRRWMDRQRRRRRHPQTRATATAECTTASPPPSPGRLSGADLSQMSE